jgi:hypothetical protein
MGCEVHLLKRLLAEDDLVYVLLHAVEEKEVLLFCDSGYWQLAEYLGDCLELPQLPQLLVGLGNHLLDELVLRR